MLAIWITAGIGVLIGFISFTRKSKVEFKNRHVLVTGGSEGIGLSVAIRLAKKGANISLLSRTDAKLKAAAATLRANMEESQRVTTVACDISASYQKVKDAIDQACSELGPVDALINCAGTSVASAFENTAVEDFERLMRLNYHGSVFATRAVIDGMKSRRSGTIVFTSSQAGQIGLYGYTAYSASKFALRGLAECLRMEVKPYGVNVSIAFPPDTDTPGYKEEIERGVPEETVIISKSSGLYTSDFVADNILKGITNGDFFIPVGFEGNVLTIITAGMAPAASVIDGIIQIILLPILRISAFFYQFQFGRIVSQCMKKKNLGQNKRD
ncbi:uncharacterized protein TRIADDRAFT_52550 [Trichoplax adhaerens]|uniref:3-dehydrosphinganine reductase n=1 Tax=Trichoplax adhaerens TaxID=10228 RepID=B3RJ30_TRIAD|nr:hypothetical protein TRIADDRAFT_52550 [Trichoplax adhaerens]EDV29794.1 hypothetical protein TRIADDRAFT_52550 [Trichoplax adhaerens]|eukprot:XP_002108996.1 hypothetical protein TRIADDRAFT_52550 [Trichoplax adhaerens]